MRHESAFGRMRAQRGQAIPCRARGFHAQELKWGGIRNGDLLSAAERERFDVLVTCDKNLQFQQHVTGRSIAVVELPANNLSDLKSIADRIRQTVDSARHGTFVSIGF